MSTHSATASYEFEDHRSSGRNPIVKAARAVFGFFEELARASEAAANYQRLSNLSDESLAKRGLKREDLPAYAYKLAFKR